MKPLSNLILIILAVGLIALSPLCAAHSDGEHFKVSPLVSKDASFQDAYHRTVILHGLNEMNKQAPYSPDSIGFDINSVNFFKTYGFTIVRLGVYWIAIEPQPGVYDTTYLLRIKKTIDMLSQNGIYTLVDFHQDGYSAAHNSGLGAPLWAALSGPAKGIDPGFPANLLGGYGISIATDEDFDFFWQNHVGPKGKFLQQSYNDMVKVVTRYFLNTPGIIGYDLMNEPFPGPSWPSCYNSTDKFRVGCQRYDMDILAPFYANLTQSIRSIDPHRIIFYEPNGFFGVGAPSFVIAPKDNNLGFSFHNYYIDNPQQVFNYANKHVAQNQSVPLMTEFGAALANPVQLKQVAELADRYQMSWLEWTYTNNPIYKFTHAKGVPDDQKEQGIVYDATKPLTDKNVKWDRLYAISRVYPEIVAGKISAYEFVADTKIFTLKYAIKDSAGKLVSSNAYSKIITPKFIYPNGYKIQTQGASVIENSDKNYLIIKNDNNADIVYLTLSPIGFNKEIRHAI